MRIPLKSAGACWAIAAALVVAGAAGAARQGTGEALARLEGAGSGVVKVERSPLTGLASFVRADPGTGIAVTGSTPAERALAFLGRHGEAFGLSQENQYEVAAVHPTDELGYDHVRVQQVHEGVPVRAAELYVHLKGDLVVGANGKTVPGLEGLDTTAAVTAGQAVDAALAMLAEKKGLTDLEVGKPRLEILNRGLLEGRAWPSQLTWFVEARRVDAREYVWVDAKSGAVLFGFSQLTDAKNRQIHDLNSGSTLPGTLIRSEGGPATGLADADLAYNYSGDTYDYFFNNFGRDSYDGAGGVLRSTVRYCPSGGPCPYQNAFWNGTQMVYGQGFSAADDVDGHELTHAVTERTAGLLYYMQSGALNESYSDVFGESMDLTNGAGNDTSGVRWQMGEDVPGLGAIRNMMNPGAFGDPAKVTGDGNFKCNPGSDNGGVHSNSGVNNHAYALAVDGGSFNGKTVTAIGLSKAGKVWYRALTQYLLSGSDFLDNYRALLGSCSDLVGTAGITAADCVEVKDALEAVEMELTVPCTPPTQAATPSFCPSGQAPTAFYMEDVEALGFPDCPSGLPTSWCRNGAGSVVGPNATSGTRSLWGYDRPTVGNLGLTLTLGGTVPAGARFQFNHQFGFEYSGASYYDGGVIDYSTNNGTTFSDAGPLINSGQAYVGTLSSCCSNPLGGRSAFAKNSWGYTATQLSLSSLAGQPLRLRWSIGTDSSGDDYGWFLDDLRGYTCVTKAPPRVDFDADDRADLTVYHEASGLWYHRDTGTGATTAQGFGGTGYKPVSGDFDGDDKTDLAVFHPATGLWFIKNSSSGTTTSLGFGGATSTTVPADFDGDGKTDLAVYYEASGLWYWRPSSTGVTQSLGYGGTNYKPVVGDYDGDGKADLAVFHVPTGLWFIRNSSTGTTTTIGFGSSTATPVPRDYDGDGKTDLAVYYEASGLWYVRSSYTTSTTSVGYGGTGYLPVPADFDGDTKADIAVYHAASGAWFIRRSRNSQTMSYAFGGSGFTPIY